MITGNNSVEFLFRVWVHPEDEDPQDVEVFYPELEPLEPGTRLRSEWALDSLQNEDFYDLFDLDKTKHWQVVGKGVVRGSYDYYGDYDEELEVVEYRKCQVPESYFDEPESAVKALEECVVCKELFSSSAQRSEGTFVCVNCSKEMGSYG